MNELSLFNSLFDDVLGDTTPSIYYRTAVSSPRVDVLEDENSYTLEMELPGRTEEEINIELNRDVLVIESKNKAAEKCEKEEKKDHAKKYILKERRSCGFERRFTMPKDIDAESIRANFKNGILTVQIQKKEEAAPKKIMIEAC